MRSLEPPESRGTSVRERQIRFAVEARLMLVGRKAVFRWIVNPSLAGGRWRLRSRFLG